MNIFPYPIRRFIDQDVILIGHDLACHAPMIIRGDREVSLSDDNLESRFELQLGPSLDELEFKIIDYSSNLLIHLL